MVRGWQQGGMGVWSLLLRKTMGTIGRSDITVPLGHFLEKLKQMAWLQLGSSSTVSPLKTQPFAFLP